MTRIERAKSPMRVLDEVGMSFRRPCALLCNHCAHTRVPVFRVLTQTVCSPSLDAQIQAVLKSLPSAGWHQFHPAGDHSARAGAQLAFGRFHNTYYRLDSADIVVSLDSDFLACGQSSTRLAHDFALRRRQGDRLDMNRLYAVESAMTSTGGKADHRLPLRYAEVEVFARDLASAVGVPGFSAPGSGAYRN